MLEGLAILLWIFAFALRPELMLFAIASGVFVGIIFGKRIATARKAMHIETPKTADGRFPILNEDWIGAVVLAIDDPEVPEIIQRHGARFRNPARYVIDVGDGGYLLYDGDGELLDICALK